ncbi:MAG: helix-turn-helix domain-containing protein [Anaerolineales bacterium]
MKKTIWTREAIAEKLAAYEAERQANGTSQRQLAEQLDVPQSTLQHWQQRKDSIDADPQVVAFFESPEGVAFLHRLVLGAHFVMTLLGACGVRLGRTSCHRHEAEADYCGARRNVSSATLSSSD